MESYIPFVKYFDVWKLKDLEPHVVEWSTGA